MINKKFVHFLHYETFLGKKLSADIDNTTYTLGVGGEILEGEPDISYQSIVYIKDKKLIFTHGQLYDASGTSEKFKEAIKINGTDFDGSEDIVTEFWGKSHYFAIVDASKTNQGRAVSVNGSDDVLFPLPSDIDANVTNDSEGNNIVETYSTKKELQDSLDNYRTFLVYSGETDLDPTLTSLPASEWTTQEDRLAHGGDYYVTTKGRIFQFYEDPNSGWMWKEITDYYLYECMNSLKSLEVKVNISGDWDNVQRNPERGNIIVRGETKKDFPYLDILCCNQNVNYRLDSASDLYLPYIYGGSWVRTMTSYSSRTPHLITTKELSKAVGKTIIVTNESISSGNLNIIAGDGASGVNITKSIAPGKICILKFCVTTISGYLCFYWEATEASPNLTWS